MLDTPKKYKVKKRENHLLYGLQIFWQEKVEFPRVSHVEWAS